MAKYFRIALAVLLLPALAESVNARDFLVTISGFPLSLGRLLFVSCGLIGLLVYKLKYIHTELFKGLIIVLGGCLIGSMFSDNSIESYSNSIGFILLLIASSGIANLFNFKLFRFLIDVYFIVLFLFWVFYTIDSTIISGQFTSYKELYKTGDFVNHHVAGLALSISSAYLAVRFFYSERKLSLLGYAVFGIAIISCLLVESRANFVFTVITFFVLLLSEKLKPMRFFIITIPSLLLIIFAMNHFASRIEFIQQRFNVRDMEYQVRTTGNRITFLEYSIDAIAKKPFGRGLEDIKLKIENKRLLPHNQYVSFAIAGGLIAILGIFIWLKNIIQLFWKAFKEKLWLWEKGRNSFMLGGLLSLLAFHITLLTVDSTGITFFILISLGLYASRSLKDELSTLYFE